MVVAQKPEKWGKGAQKYNKGKVVKRRENMHGQC
jgi:hypothetical protein